MNTKIIKFEIVTPEKHLLKELVLAVTVPTREGQVTILPKHTPLVSNLKPGVLEFVKEDGLREVVSVSGGFLEVLRNKVVILADTAERAVDISEEQIAEARRLAEKEMKELKSSDAERFASINAKLERDLARTKAIKRWKRIKNMR